MPPFLCLPRCPHAAAGRSALPRHPGGAPPGWPPRRHPPAYAQGRHRVRAARPAAWPPEPAPCSSPSYAVAPFLRRPPGRARLPSLHLGLPRHARHHVADVADPAPRPACHPARAPAGMPGPGGGASTGPRAGAWYPRRAGAAPHTPRTPHLPAPRGRHERHRRRVEALLTEIAAQVRHRRPPPAAPALRVPAACPLPCTPPAGARRDASHYRC